MRNDRVLPMTPLSPMAIPELGLAYMIKNQVDTTEGPASSGGLQKDDEIVEITFHNTKPDGSIDKIRDHQAPWGVHRQGGFIDPFGHLWLVGDRSPLRKYDPR